MASPTGGVWGSPGWNILLVRGRLFPSPLTSPRVSPPRLEGIHPREKSSTLHGKGLEQSSLFTVCLAHSRCSVWIYWMNLLCNFEPFSQLLWASSVKIGVALDQRLPNALPSFLAMQLLVHVQMYTKQVKAGCSGWSRGTGGLRASFAWLFPSLFAPGSPKAPSEQSLITIRLMNPKSPHSLKIHIAL